MDHQVVLIHILSYLELLDVMPLQVRPITHVVPRTTIIITSFFAPRGKSITAVACKWAFIANLFFFHSECVVPLRTVLGVRSGKVVS